MNLARSVHEQTGWPLAVRVVDENHFSVEIPEGWFLDAAGPDGGYEFGRHQGRQ